MVSQALIRLFLGADHIAVHLIIRLIIGKVPWMFDDGIFIGFADISRVAHGNKVWWLLQVHNILVAFSLLIGMQVVDDNVGCFFGGFRNLACRISKL